MVNDGEPSEDKILRRYHFSRETYRRVVEVGPAKHSLSERIDSIVLNRWLGVPFFLMMIYLMFTFAVNVGDVFIDFFDILSAAFLVDGVSWLLHQVDVPEILITFGGPRCWWWYYSGRNVYSGHWIPLSSPVGSRRFRLYVTRCLRD